MFDLSHRFLYDLRGRDLHSLFQSPSICLLSVDRESLAFGDLELLIGAIFKGQDYRTGWGDVPNFSRDRLDRGDGFRSCCRRDRALQFHSRL